MCGIVGSVNTGLDLNAAIAALGHRGPDSSGAQDWQIGDSTVRLGHARLAILDLSPAGHQPMTSSNGRWSITYNGEIYNHLDLRRSLPGPFRGHSDTETLVEHLATHGMQATLPLLNGMFAFAALDHEERKLWLVRDPFGIKPLYWHSAGEGFAFASEIRGLASVLGTKLEMDPTALQTFLTLRFTPSPETIWTGVRRLAPGHLIEIDLSMGNAETRCYIEPTTDRFDGSIDEAVERYHDLLLTGIERQLLSDVPVGILLSSGVDSAVVAALAKEAGRELPCYTVGFDDGHAESEIPGARETCQVLGLPFIGVNVGPSEVMAVIDDVIGALEEPIVSTAPLVLWALVQRAREDVTVALTGQGSDEPWGGYTRYYNEVVRRRLPFPGALRAAERAAPVVARLPEAVGRALRSLPEPDMAARFEQTYALFTADQRAELTGSASAGGSQAALNYWMDWNAPAGCTPVEEMMRVDTRTCLGDDWLLYGDKISMAHSLEVRVPILDIDVVRFVESLPIDFRIRLGKRKLVHKKMAEQYLPSEIVNRKKLGFPTPFSSWARAELKDDVRDLLFDELPRDGLFQRKPIERLFDEHQAGRDRGRQLYALYMLASMRRRFGA